MYGTLWLMDLGPTAHNLGILTVLREWIRNVTFEKALGRYIV